MPVVYNNTWSNTATGGAVLEVTTVAPTGTDRLLVVQVGGSGDSAGDNLDSITKGATTVATEEWGLANPAYWSFYQRSLIAPSTTSETVTATYAGSRDGFSVVVMSFTGVHQTTPLDTATTANADGFDPTGISITSATGDMVVSGIACGWTTGLTFQGDGTERFNGSGIGNYFNAAAATAAGAGTVNVEWGGGSGYANAHIMGGVNINEAAAAPGGAVSYLTLLGVG